MNFDPYVFEIVKILMKKVNQNLQLQISNQYF